jgi:hypothetical protein
MSTLPRFLHHSRLAILIVLCLAALTATSVYAGGQARPLAATDLLGSPDAAVNGKFAVGSASVGTKALTVTGVIDFLGAGTVHNYFTQGGGNNMQINTNVDEANAVGDASKSQWKLVLGSSLDQFSIRRSPAGGTYNEDALFFINGSTGNVGIATVDTGNGATIPFTPSARLHVQTASGPAIYGVTSSSSDNAVAGWSSATAGLGSGVLGESSSTSGRGVMGWTAATTGTTHGVEGQSASTDGSGVFGWATATTGTTSGVYGTSNSTSGRGVYGRAFATSGTTYGVYGQTFSPSGYAGYFEGNVHVNGTLSKTAGSFKIDDPLDPAHKYLQHSFVESPDMMNVYNGNVTLDDQGEAIVTMPDWFQALNQDFRYQLTAIGAPGPNLYIAQKIKDNKFQIAGGEAGMEVSWLVTGIRHDPYAEAHRIQVVIDKPASEQGTYLFPDLYGQPASKGVDYAEQSNLDLGNPPEVPQAK